MEIPDELLYVSKRELERDGRQHFTFAVPPSEIRANDALNPGEEYQIAVFATETEEERDTRHPVSDGDVLEDVTIETEGSEGDGVVTVGDTGFVVFVPDVGVGDTVDVRIANVEDTYAFAEVVGDE